MHGVPADGTGLRLEIGFGKESGLECYIIESSNDLILASVKSTNYTTIVGNVYRSPSSERAKIATLKEVGRSNKCLGWNIVVHSLVGTVFC